MASGCLLFALVAAVEGTGQAQAPASVWTQLPVIALTVRVCHHTINAAVILVLIGAH